MGRISTYNEITAELICDRLADGESLRSICRDPEMPNWRTVYRWMDADTDFAARLAGARDIGADVVAMECLEIADRPLTAVDASADVSNRKLQIETRMKLLAKWHPRKYGEKLDIDAKIDVIHKLDEMSELERAKRVAFVIAKGLMAAKTLELSANQEEQT